MSGFDAFFQEIEPLLFTLAPVVVPILLAYLTTVVKREFEKLPTAQRSLLASVVQTAVTATEQTGFGKLNGSEKKLVAMQAIHAQLAHFKLSVPDSVIEPMLEESVLIMNIAQGKPADTPKVLPEHA